jgi:hypothetical protein
MKKTIFVFATNGSIRNTGIESVANGLASSYEQKIDFFSTTSNDSNLPIFNSKEFLFDQLEIVLFSHLEYSNLIGTIKKLKPKIVYVGDWILNYRISLFKWKPNLKNLLKIVLSYYRAHRVLFNIKHCYLIYVNEFDMMKSKNFGFKNSIYIPLGHFNKLENSSSEKPSFNPKLIAFSGNFEYDPNESAAKFLIEFIKIHENYKLLLIGKSASKFKNLEIPNLEIYSDVDSVVEILKFEKPIYIAPVFFGAGSKNKILEAAASRIPIICTIECLDFEFYTKYNENFFLIQKGKSIFTQIRNHLSKIESDGWDDEIIYHCVVKQRHWNEISKKFKIILNEIYLEN